MHAPLESRLLKKRPPGRIGGRLLALRETASTNDAAWEALSCGEAGPGDVVFAESQTAGRGRGSNRWFSPPWSGLLFSVVLRPSLPPERAPWITQVAGLAITFAARGFGADARLKWPNDVLAGGAKLCGILTESRTAPDGSIAAVLGVGFNVLARHGDFPAELSKVATSLLIETGRELSREEVLDALLDLLDDKLALLEAGLIAQVDREIAAVSAVLGKRVRLLAGSEPKEGRVAEQTLEKGIVLEMPGGRREAFFGPHIRAVEIMDY